MEMRSKLVAGGADLVNMRRVQDRGVEIFGALVLDAIEPDVGPRLQDVDIDRIGQVFDVEDALAIDGHQDPSGSLKETRKASAPRAPSMRSSRFCIIAAYDMAVPATAGRLAQITVLARTC